MDDTAAASARSLLPLSAMFSSIRRGTFPLCCERQVLKEQLHVPALWREFVRFPWKMLTQPVALCSEVSKRKPQLVNVLCWKWACSFLLYIATLCGYEQDTSINERYDNSYTKKCHLCCTQNNNYLLTSYVQNCFFYIIANNINSTSSKCISVQCCQEKGQVKFIFQMGKTDLHR